MSSSSSSLAATGNDDVLTCNEPHHKKSKLVHALSLSGVIWHLFLGCHHNSNNTSTPTPTTSSTSSTTTRIFHINDTVFWRSKSAKELGKRGTIIAFATPKQEPPSKQQQQQPQRVVVRFQRQWDTIHSKDNSNMNNSNHSESLIHTDAYEKEVSTKRLVPVFSPQTQPQNQRQQHHGVMTTIVVTDETIPYRNLASSQLCNNDVVLEIGCSTGEASVHMIPYCKSWVGLDTSHDMVQHCNHRIQQQKQQFECNHLDNNNEKIIQYSAYRVDALVDPIRAEQLVRQGLNNKLPNKIFIDIGGNRDCQGVWRMLAWVMPMNPDFVVIKSRALALQLQNEPDILTAIGTTKTTTRTESDCATLTAAIGLEWMNTKLQEWNNPVDRLPSHPLQAPLRHVGAKPVCRYHNYHTNGCLRYANKDNPCPLDHDHCHKCLVRGHVARYCPRLAMASGTFAEANDGGGR